MRKYIILFALSVFFAGMTYYLAHALNPFDETQIANLVATERINLAPEFEQVVTELIDRGLIAEFLNIRNVVLLLSTALLSVLTGFMFAHTVVDKLFFRKFYEQPSLLLALRRGLFVCFALMSLFIYRLYAVEWYLQILTLGLLLIVELVIGRLAPLKPLEDLPGEGPEAETDEDGVRRQLPKLQLPNIRRWPQMFRETVMRQVAEVQGEEDEDEQTT